ncbi:hypothetical protein AA989_11925 [Enterococcus cecorum]|nr:hypothetical protein AA989_11925 [Enterococcus cecorum]
MIKIVLINVILKYWIVDQTIELAQEIDAYVILISLIELLKCHTFFYINIADSMSIFYKMSYLFLKILLILMKKMLQCTCI